MFDLRLIGERDIKKGLGFDNARILAGGKVNTRQDFLMVFLFLLIISLFEVHTLQIIQFASLFTEVRWAHGLLVGHPEYRVFQNRLLGPVLVLAVSKITGSNYALAYANTLTALFTLPIFLIYYLVQRITGYAKVGLAASGVYAVLTILLQDKSWFCIWDAIDFTTMTVFAYTVFNVKSDLKILIPLFVVELLNRESAGFIAVWICLSALTSLIAHNASSTKKTSSVARLAVGSALMIFGTIWVHSLRKILFISSIEKSVGVDAQHNADGQWITILQNLSTTAIYGDVAAYSIAVICCLTIGFMLYRLNVILGHRSYPVIALITVMALAVWTFGGVTETRVWLNFIPFIIFYVVSVEEFHTAKAESRQRTRVAA